MKTVTKNMMLVFSFLAASVCFVEAAEDPNYPLTPDTNTVGLWHMDSIVTTPIRHTVSDPLSTNKQMDLTGCTIVSGATANTGNAIHFSGDPNFGKTDSNSVWQDDYEVFEVQGWCKFDDINKGFRPISE